jgi:hypothetical protein
MRDVLKLLNDKQPSELLVLDERELQRLEALCEIWRVRANDERARRQSFPLEVR